MQLSLIYGIVFLRLDFEKALDWIYVPIAWLVREWHIPQNVFYYPSIRVKGCLSDLANRWTDMVLLSREVSFRDWGGGGNRPSPYQEKLFLRLKVMTRYLLSFSSVGIGTVSLVGNLCSKAGSFNPSPTEN